MTILLLLSALTCISILTYSVFRLIYVSVHNRLITRKANKLGTPGLCCCGSMIDDHGWGENHPFVSEIDYYIESNTKKF